MLRLRRIVLLALTTLFVTIVPIHAAQTFWFTTPDSIPGTVNVPNSGPHVFTFRVWFGAISETLSPISPSITVTSTNYVITIVPVTVTLPVEWNGNSRTLRIVFEKGSFHLDWFRFAVAAGGSRRQ